MFTLRKSMVLGPAFFTGVAIAARADPLCRIPIGRRRPGPQIAARSFANVAPAPDSETRQEVKVPGPQPAGASCQILHADTKDQWGS